MRTTGHKVLITGGTRGIGLAIAERFAAEGNDIVVVGSSESSVSRVLEKHPEWSGRACDLADRQARADLLAWVAESHSDLSVFINNAGVQDDDAITRGDVSAMEREIGINVDAVVHLCQGMVAVLELRDEAALVNVSSGLAIAPKASALTAEQLADELWRGWQADRYYIPAGQTRLLEMVNRLSPSLARRIMKTK